MLPIGRNEGLSQRENDSAEQTRRQQQGRGKCQYVRDSQELAKDTIGEGAVVSADMAGVRKMVNALFTFRALRVFRMPVEGGRQHGRQVNCQQKGGNYASDLFHSRLQRYNKNTIVVSFIEFSLRIIEFQ